MIIKTSDTKGIKPFLNKLYIPPKESHKGQNGKVLVIGGSSLFHSASIWAAEIASHIVDMVFYSSIKENNNILHESKTKFHNGIVVERSDVEHYIAEADCILIGSGMMRTDKPLNPTEEYSLINLNELDHIENEGVQTYYLTRYVLKKYPYKKFVLDAGALQMMEKNWLLTLEQPAVLTPHHGEYLRLFDSIPPQKSAHQYNCVIVHKFVADTVTDGEHTYKIEGGNQGLTKGGTGDLLAGLVASLYAKNDAITSGVLASFLLKKSADRLHLTKGYWYNINDLIDVIPSVLTELQNL